MAAVLAVLWLALPVTLPRADVHNATAECLSLNTPAASPDVTTLERCRALQPRDTQLLVALGDAYQKAGDDRRAEGAFREVLRVDPGYAEVRLRMARILLAGQRFEAAEVELNAALRVQPNRRELQTLLEAVHAGARMARR